MFSDVPALGLFFTTLLCEFCAALGAALSVRAWTGHAGIDGLLVGALLCAAAIGCGVGAGRYADRMQGRWAAGIVAATTTLLWVFVFEAHGGWG